MPQGLQIFKVDGSIRLDTSTQLGRVIGSIQVAAGQKDGTISSEQFSQGQAFIVGMFSLGAFTGSVLTGPAFSQVSYTRSGNSLIWTRVTNQYETNLPSGIMYYGVF